MTDAGAARPCHCGSGYPLAACCVPYVAGLARAPTAAALMRSRYTAFVLGNAAYLRASWHPSTRPATIHLDPHRRWLGLRVRKVVAGEAGDTDGQVEFVARYRIDGRGHRLHETSSFRFEDGQWFYLGPAAGAPGSRR